MAIVISLLVQLVLTMLAFFLYPKYQKWVDQQEEEKDQKYNKLRVLWDKVGDVKVKSATRRWLNNNQVWDLSLLDTNNKLIRTTAHTDDIYSPKEGDVLLMSVQRDKYEGGCVWFTIKEGANEMH